MSRQTREKAFNVFNTHTSANCRDKKLLSATTTLEKNCHSEFSI